MALEQPEAALMMEVDEGSDENPFMNEDILENVLGYLDVQDLKQCRLVNSLWNLVTNRVVGPKIRPIHFVSEKSSEKDHYYTSKPCGIHKMKELLGLLSSSWNFPCKKFELQCNLTTNVDEDQIVASVLEKVAVFATELTVSDGGGDDNNRLFSAANAQEIQYECLRSLKLNLRGGKEEDLQEKLEFPKVILKHAPTLEGLHLDLWIYRESQKTINALALLELIDCSKIREFSLNAPQGQVGYKHLEKCLEMGLVNLEKLDVDITVRDPTESSESLRNFLETNSSTLKSLFLSFSDLDSPISVELPDTPMPRLKYLRLGAYSFGPFKISFPAISFARQLPALKCLQFDGFITTSLGAFLYSSQQPVETVQELELPENLRDINVIFEAARIFPKVKKLEVPGRVNVMNAVYQAFENVEELNLVIGDGFVRVCLVDMVLTGYTDDELRQIRGLSPRLFEMVNRLTEPNPFLNRLKVLNIKYTDEISDLSCRLVLLKLKELRCLDFGLTCPSKITKAMIQEMRGKFRVLFKKENWKNEAVPIPVNRDNDDLDDSDDDLEYYE